MYDRSTSPGDGNRGRDENSRRDDLGPMDRPSQFVASLTKLLAESSVAGARECANYLLSRPSMTSNDFLTYFESANGQQHRGILAHAVYRVVKESKGADVFQDFPALVSIAHCLVTGGRREDAVAVRKLSRASEIVLDTIWFERESDLVPQWYADEGTRTKLEEMISRSEAEGSWRWVELLMTLYPDGRSLRTGVELLRRAFTSLEPDKDAVACFGRGASWVGGADFRGTVQFLAEQPIEERSPVNQDIYDALVHGLALSVPRHLSVLKECLKSDDPDVCSQACAVAVITGLDDDRALSPDERTDLVETIRERLHTLDASTVPSFVADQLYCAWTALTVDEQDLKVIRERLRLKAESHNIGEKTALDILFLSLMRCTEVWPVRPIPPFSRAPRVPLRMQEAPVGESAPDQSDDDGMARYNLSQKVEDFALSIAQEKSKRTVRLGCEELSQTLRPEGLVARSDDDLGMFFEASRALGFMVRFDYILSKGFFDVAAVILPEVLSALSTGVLTEDDWVGQRICRYAAVALSKLSTRLELDGRLRELAASRMSDNDWGALRGFHGNRSENLSDVFPRLTFDVFEIRALLERGSAWQDDLHEFWSSLRDSQFQMSETNRLVRLSTLSERMRPGSALELLQKSSLAIEDREAFRCIARGLLERPMRHCDAICEMVSQDSGHDKARGFLLAQAMASYLAPAQRDFILNRAREAVDEFGALSLDAIATIGLLSESEDDVSFVLGLDAVPGVEPSLHEVTSALSAATILFKNAGSILDG